VMVCSASAPRWARCHASSKMNIASAAPRRNEIGGAIPLRQRRRRTGGVASGEVTEGDRDHLMLFPTVRVCGISAPLSPQ
jgi:hypothetical protein